MDATPNRFPGAQPVSFAKHHLDVLERDNYFVSEKADGVRCLLYMHVGDDGGFETFLLVLDIDGPKRILRFLLFDCVVLDGESLMRKTFDKRLGRLREFILKPHDAYLATHPEYAAVVPFSVELKELQLAYHLWAVMQQQPTLKHGSDGLLFTARDAPYVSGQCDQMIKWKPSEENTADFKIRYEPGSPPRFFLQIMQKGNVHSDITEMRPEPELLEEWTLSPPAGRIVECRYDPEWPGNWRFMRFRDDKDTANFVDVLNSIMQSIRDNVGEEEVCRAGRRLSRLLTAAM
ncbi:hypothetical protein DFJ74DRAFT_601806 [Hyaloraphidium curvatum]|nr:hypothetical protein DFJ74DRAFT_601806 [Hyaloraphidium curvatum]